MNDTMRASTNDQAPQNSVLRPSCALVSVGCSRRSGVPQASPSGSVNGEQP